MPNFKTPLVWAGASAMLLAACSRTVRTPLPTVASAAGASSVPAGSCGRRHPGVGAERMGSIRASASVALAQTRAPDRNVIAYIADGDDTILRTIDVATRREIAATPLRGRPEQVLVLADGRVAVTLRFSNALEVLEPAPRADSA